MKRMLLTLAIAAGTGVLALPAKAATTVETVPVSGVFFNSCTEELMFVESTITLVTGSTADASGGIHFGPTHFTQHGTAIGLTSGNRYVFSAAQTNMENFTDPADERTLVGDVVAISQGSEPNLISQATFHATITPTGELAAFFTNINFRCSGNR